MSIIALRRAWMTIKKGMRTFAECTLAREVGRSWRFWLIKRWTVGSMIRACLKYWALGKPFVAYCHRLCNAGCHQLRFMPLNFEALIRFREVFLAIDYWQIIQPIFWAYLIRVLSSFYAKNILLSGRLRSFNMISADVKRAITNIACLRFLIVLGIIGRALIFWFDVQDWKSEISNLKVIKLTLDLILFIKGKAGPLWMRYSTI